MTFCAMTPSIRRSRPPICVAPRKPSTIDGTGGAAMVGTRFMEGLASEAAAPKTVMIDMTYLKAHRTATSVRSKRGATIKGAV